LLEYRDLPGSKTRPHRHPDSVMYTLSAFQRRLHAGQGARDVVMEPGHAHWLPAQTHAGENIGTTPTHVLFVELKDAGTTGPAHRGGTSHSGDAPPARPAIGPS
jgi:beta-alanine degradation protein BauB